MPERIIVYNLATQSQAACAAVEEKTEAGLNKAA
jgi:hypothetical protein